jgi:hypothetical protein
MSGGGPTGGATHEVSVTLTVGAKDSPPTTVTVGNPHNPLPLTGAAVVPELGASAMLILAGALLALAGRRWARVQRLTRPGGS